GLIVVICVAGLFAWRASTAKKSPKVADSAAEADVQVVFPQKPPATVELKLPGHTYPYYEAPIYAQTSGYLKMWYHDIGAKVKAGDVLGEIDTPEVDQELSQAKATLATAKAQLALATSNFNEAKRLWQTNVDSKRDFETMQSNYLAKQATSNADADAVGRLQALENFKYLRAPFDGIVTSRSTDIGDYVAANSGQKLFIVDKENPLRVYVNVPENFAKQVKVGSKADLSLDEFPGRLFPATVVTTSDAVNPSNRTQLVELQVSNPSYELWPGAYTEVHFHLASAGNTVYIPENTLLFRREGPAVGVVQAGGKVEIRQVQIALDTGTQLEIIKGLSTTDQIIVNPSDSLSTGMVVHVQTNEKSEKMAEN
ncbi:MAG TPA: efflux RND transporter periplasmic adaptor subunit, partial [Chthoniobacterales bacterium]|nr:efflux RND transporter periplasmic adaptor subunit [Chthoniobacterales bacterium]